MATSLQCLTMQKIEEKTLIIKYVNFNKMKIPFKSVYFEPQKKTK